MSILTFATMPILRGYLYPATLLFTVLVIAGSCQNKRKLPVENVLGETFVPDYKLIVPDNWSTERFGIPIEFAPSIPYVGVEDLRFAPGWDDPTSEEYWTYSYLWYLNGKTTFNAVTIAQNLEEYYSGLVGQNIGRRKIPAEKLVPVTAKFEMVEPYDGDQSTFNGSVHMLDYMAQKPMTLNIVVHVKECSGKDNTYVYYEVSPQVTGHDVWKTLDNIWTAFECDKGT